MSQETPSKKLFRKARHLARELVNNPELGVEGVFVFGSVAANLAKEGSDIDVLIAIKERPDGATLKVKDLLIDFDKRKGVEIGFTVKTTSEFVTEIKKIIENPRRVITNGNNFEMMIRRGCLPLYISPAFLQQTGITKKELIERLRPRTPAFMSRLIARKSDVGKRIEVNKKKNRNRFMR